MHAHRDDLSTIEKTLVASERPRLHEEKLRDEVGLPRSALDVRTFP